ncbi:7-carboxy-7-deazaguanine synthase QueE [Methanoregula sp. UBA64]|jgi:7-carboxy-7-deazaguanine synthase|uniref:7-carboxy-7-deazaguanine synthase QueE n=1 Tax=Methanoregula sp. UBA64 TaxID=1915554 RepID=UPI0025DAFB43|nr:radical SAM protein [Methanoregula sp. UBA64]
MKLAEIFSSLQGEGVRQGAPCLFVRLSGCNLSCRWCDTREALTGGTEVSEDVVLEQCWRQNPRYVCITGGEPLLQTEALLPLLLSLQKRGIAIDIETNGTIDFTPVQPYASVCMDVKCPSSGERSDLSLLAKIRPEDSVKFVVADLADCRFAHEVIDSHPIAGPVFFSPVFGADTEPLVRYILKNNLPVRFQVQLHKVLGVK